MGPEPGPEQRHLPGQSRAHAGAVGQCPDRQQTAGRGWTCLPTAGRGLICAKMGLNVGQAPKLLPASLGLEPARGPSLLPQILEVWGLIWTCNLFCRLIFHEISYTACP